MLIFNTLLEQARELRRKQTPARLVIELDGAPHAEPDRREADSARDNNMRAEGHTVLRFWNAQVLNETETVLCQIAACLPGAEGAAM